MAFNQVTATSLTPSRPAPPIPLRQASTSSSSSTFTSSSSLTLAPSIVSTSTYVPSYSGIGGTPNIGGFPKRSSDNSTNNVYGIVRQGAVGFKEDAFASWLWREKWLVLREQSLSVHKNEVSFPSNSWKTPGKRDSRRKSFADPRSFLRASAPRHLDDPRFSGNFEQCIADQANTFSY
jgi:hypothetical protein